MVTGATGAHASEMFNALDVGTSKVVALIAQVDEKGQLKVVGAGRSVAQGLRKGIVINTADATAAIAKAIEEAERTAGRDDGFGLREHLRCAHQRDRQQGRG